MNEIKIDRQIWMCSNLDVDHYRNGDPIPQVRGKKKWENLKTGAWCYYDNDPENGGKFGKLYNWYAVNDPRGLAPEGWRVPSEEELDEFLDAAETDDFNALFGGCRDCYGDFYNIGLNAYFWSSTTLSSLSAWYMTLVSSNSFTYLSFNYYAYGFSVRCIKD